MISTKKYCLVLSSIMYSKYIHTSFTLYVFSPIRGVTEYRDIGNFANVSFGLKLRKLDLFWLNIFLLPVDIRDWGGEQTPQSTFHNLQKSITADLLLYMLRPISLRVTGFAVQTGKRKRGWIKERPRNEWGRGWDTNCTEVCMRDFLFPTPQEIIH